VIPELDCSDSKSATSSLSPPPHGRPLPSTTHHQQAKAVHDTNASDDAAQRDLVGRGVGRRTHSSKGYVFLLITLFFNDYTTQQGTKAKTPAYEPSSRLPHAYQLRPRTAQNATQHEQRRTERPGGWEWVVVPTPQNVRFILTICSLLLTIGTRSAKRRLPEPSSRLPHALVPQHNQNASGGFRFMMRDVSGLRSTWRSHSILDV
jgi:hypothetical protein